MRDAADGGRVAVCEILRMTGRVRDKIINPNETADLTSVITDGAYDGTQTFDQALYAHVTSGRVSLQDALNAATSPHDFKLLLDAQGRSRAFPRSPWARRSGQRPARRQRTAPVVSIASGGSRRTKRTPTIRRCS
jgi:hypothetical protein